MKQLHWLALAFVVSLTATCSVSVPSGAKFVCANDADCDGDGFKCSKGVCCRPETETCNGLDDDCDGVADNGVAAAPCYSGPAGTEGVGACAGGTQACVAGAFAACTGEALPKTEVCNGADDDCDGTPDNGIDFQNDAKNCGQCGKACQAFEACAQGACKVVAEGNCADGADDDADSKIDCDDDDCTGKSCGAGCACKLAAKGEVWCGDGADNDGDGMSDCADSDCDLAACGAGCDGGSCSAGCACTAGAKKETDCTNAKDDDNDAKLDCVDVTDCVGQLCRAGKTFRCNAALACVCPQLPDGGGGTTLPPAEQPQTDGGAPLCFNGRDDDCDGTADCADPKCGAARCGTGCGCAGGRKAELICNDLADNDGDALIDCADVLDCPLNAVCRKGTGMAMGNCAADMTCQ